MRFLNGTAAALAIIGTTLFLGGCGSSSGTTITKTPYVTPGFSRLVAPANLVGRWAMTATAPVFGAAEQPCSAAYANGASCSGTEAADFHADGILLWDTSGFGATPTQYHFTYDKITGTITTREDRAIYDPVTSAVSHPSDGFSTGDPHLHRTLLSDDGATLAVENEVRVEFYQKATP